MKDLIVTLTIISLGFCYNVTRSQNIVINEVMSSNQSAILDEDGDTPDWIEIYNNSSEAVDLDGYGISDDAGDPMKWVIPGKVIGAHDYLLIFASGKNRTGEGQWETIVNWGDDWKYFVPTTELADNWRLPEYNDSGWSEGPSGFGYGDDDDSTLVGQTMSVFIRKSFPAQNLSEILDAVLHVDYDDGFVAYLNGQEIARANIGTPGIVPAFDDSASSVVEPQIYQGGHPFSFPVDRSLLVNGNNLLAIEVHNFTITSSDLTLIPFFSLLLESPPPNPSGTPDIIQLPEIRMHTNFKIGIEGETICLSDPAGTLIDSVQTGNLAINVSKGRQPDGSANWCYFSQSTPLAANVTECWPGVAGIVQFSFPGGFYPSGIQLQLSSDNPGDIIHYTTDGTEPDESSNIYQSTLFLTTTKVVRAIAVHQGYLPARSVTHTYFINEEHDLPVFSISTAPENLFDPAIGIYHDNNVWQDWERPIHIEFYDDSDNLGFSIDAGVKIFGGWTRTLPQKSLAIYARESYGYGDIEYPLFPDLPFGNYESFVLRNSGNDWQNTMIRDGVMTGLVKNDGIDIQAFRPAVVYINGQYWGIHNIREKFNDQYIEMHHGISRDNIDLIENQLVVMNGDLVDYNQLISYMTTHSMSVPSYYEYIKTQIDIPEFISYQVAQIYFANTDWPGNNIKYWRERDPDGRWKWMLYDTDFGFGLATDYTHNTLAFATDPAGPDWPNPPWSTFLLRELLKNSEFRIDFINRYADLMNSSFRADTVLAQIDEKKALIITEMPNQCQRWGSDMWTWLQNVTVMRTFANFRKFNAQSHVIQYFDLADVSSVTLNVYPGNSGTIDISTLQLEDFPWTGEYFNNVPVKLKATAKPGYKFVRWEGGIESDTNCITVYFSSDQSITAVFEAYTPSYLVINEINYNSSVDFNPADWVEFYNPNGYEVNLDGWYFMDEEEIHKYSFESGLTLGNNGFLILCEDTALFHSAFPEVINYTGNFEFGLSGGGELIRLYDFSGVLIDTVNYDDKEPWPAEADGEGPSLELIDPSYDNALWESWQASGQHGTPGSPNGIYIDIGENVENSGLDLRIVPNPMASSVNLIIISPVNQKVKFEILNFNGLKVKEYPVLSLGKGIHSIVWNGEDSWGNLLGPGIYFCRITSSSKSLVKKLIKLN